MVIGNVPLKPAGVTFWIVAVIAEVRVGSMPATVAVAVVPVTLMLTIEKNGNCVGPLYGGSELLIPVPDRSGCVIVLVGHCTRNDWALAATVAKTTTRMEIQTRDDFLMAVQPPSYPEPLQTTPMHDSVAVMPFPR
jgi:hypothetical protein